jgi:NADH-dependent peroxiredoxin subunit C
LYPNFKQLNCEILGISTDSIYAHKVFVDTSPSAKKVQYPLVSDRNQRISRAYRVLDAHGGASFRATVVIDPDGRILSKIVYPTEVGRNIQELLRMLYGIQHAKKTGEGVPSNWMPGMPGIQSDFENVGKI